MVTSVPLGSTTHDHGIAEEGRSFAVLSAIPQTTTSPASAREALESRASRLHCGVAGGWSHLDDLLPSLARVHEVRSGAAVGKSGPKPQEIVSFFGASRRLAQCQEMLLALLVQSGHVFGWRAAVAQQHREEIERLCRVDRWRSPFWQKLAQLENGLLAFSACGQTQGEADPRFGRDGSAPFCRGLFEQLDGAVGILVSKQPRESKTVAHVSGDKALGIGIEVGASRNINLVGITRTQCILDGLFGILDVPHE